MFQKAVLYKRIFFVGLNTQPWKLNQIVYLCSRDQRVFNIWGSPFIWPLLIQRRCHCVFPCLSWSNSYGDGEFYYIQRKFGQTRDIRNWKFIVLSGFKYLITWQSKLIELLQVWSEQKIEAFFNQKDRGIWGKNAYLLVYSSPIDSNRQAPERLDGSHSGGGGEGREKKWVKRATIYIIDKSSL